MTCRVAVFVETIILGIYTLYRCVYNCCIYGFMLTSRSIDVTALCKTCRKLNFYLINDNLYTSYID